MENRITNPDYTIPYMQNLYLDKIDHFLSRIEDIQSRPITSSGHEEIVHCKEKIMRFKEQLLEMPT